MNNTIKFIKENKGLPAHLKEDLSVILPMLDHPYEHRKHLRVAAEVAQTARLSATDLITQSLYWAIELDLLDAANKMEAKQHKPTPLADAFRRAGDVRA
jgi:hypothetical protein